MASQHIDERVGIWPQDRQPFAGEIVVASDGMQSAVVEPAQALLGVIAAGASTLGRFVIRTFGLLILATFWRNGVYSP